MSKYQEALNEIKSIKLKQGNYTIFALRYVLESEIKLLQELVDKSIPLKPVHIGKFIYCPICKEHGFGLWDDAIPNENDTYCGRCGQKIDWSEDAS